jgi:hypothetical protein
LKSSGLYVTHFRDSSKEIGSPKEGQQHDARFLGRFLRSSEEILASIIGRLGSAICTDPRFIPANLREEYSALTGIEMLPTPLPERFSIINDPDTGIRLPGEANQREGRTHIAINAIISQLEDLRPKCIITFDQSDYRHSGQTLEQQRGTKLGELRTRLRYGFYYVSHAPFLFTFSNQSDMQYVQTLIVEAGIPAHRIQLPTGGSSLTFQSEQ